MDVKTTVNQFIIDELEEGNVPRKKTRNTIQFSGSTQNEYRGFNQLLLQVVKIKKQFESNRRVTFKQVEQL
jgi:antirestriction protein ArdC